MDEAAVLRAGAQALGAALDARQAEALLLLLDELTHWNRAYNLTAVTSRAEMITHHLLDSLSVAPYLQGPRVADVGTGAGFPGLPLAVARPDLRFTLIDSGGKKQRFVAHAAHRLGLQNVEAVQARVEALRPEAPFDAVVARAFATLPRLLGSVAPLVGPSSRVLAMKGLRPDSEINDVGPPWRVLETLALHVPGLDEARHLVIAGRLPP